MFVCVLNMHLGVVVNEVRFDEEPAISIKNQQKMKALLNGTDVVSVEQ